MREVMASTQQVNKLCCEEMKRIERSVKTRANNDNIFSGDKHSNNGKSGKPDQTFG